MNNSLKKINIFFVFILISVVCFSQNEVVKDSVSTKKISIFKNKYFYLNNAIPEKDLHQLLRESNNKQIIRLIKESKNRKIAQYTVGFMTIPLAYASVYAFHKSFLNSEWVYNSNGDMHKILNRDYVFLGVMCSIATIACPFSSHYYKKQRKKYNLRAIQLYNQVY